MNSRERMLGLTVGVLALLIGGYYAWDSFDASIAAREQQITQLEGQISGKERRLRTAKRDVARLNVYREQSLPTETDLARSLYQTWLLEAVQSKGLVDINVSTLGARGRRDAYFVHTFNVTARGDLAKVTRLMHDYYSRDRLQRIRRISLKPLRDSKDLELSMSIEALSLAKADHEDSLNDAPSKRLARESVDEYLQIVGGRNLFGPPNAPPRIASPGSQRTVIDRPFRLTIKADDPDKLDQVTYKLADGAPAGATINERTGEFSWTPRAKGDFSAKVVAIDNGLPSKTSELALRISVTDPPPPPAPEPPVKKKLEFDDAKYTFVTGLLNAGGEMEVWLTIRTSGKVLKLRTGDSLSVGSIEGKVVGIDEEKAVIETPEQKFIVFLGEKLLDGRPTN